MSNRILRINTYGDKFHMELNLDAFFPASKKDIQRLITMNIYKCPDEKELMSQLVDYLNEQIEASKEAWKNASNRYVSHHQNYADVKVMIESGKHSNGVPIEFGEMKRLEKDFKHLKSMDKSSLSELKKAKKLHEKYVENLVFVNKKFR